MRIGAPARVIDVGPPGTQGIARELLGSVPELRGNLTHDFHTAVLMREHGVSRIYTRDAEFHRFPWVDVVDPL